MRQLSKIKRAVVLLALIAITACAASPWKQEQSESHMNIGVAYLGSERYNEALKEFFEAEKLTPRDPKVHYYMGIAYYRKSLNENAISEFTKALSYKPDYAEAHNFLGAIYLEKGLWDNAIESFKNALANIFYETPDKAYFNLGMAYHGKGEYQKALDSYREAKIKKPNTVPPPLIDLHMGLSYYAKGDLEKAFQYFKASLKAAPSLVEARYWLGQCYIKMNDHERARVELKAVIAAAPESDLATAARKSLDSLSGSRR